MNPAASLLLSRRRGGAEGGAAELLVWPWQRVGIRQDPTVRWGRRQQVGRNGAISC